MDAVVNAAEIPGPNGPLGACPACGAAEVLPVLDLDDTNFLCTRCGKCWHVEFGVVYRVDPLTCAGCAHRDECLARLGDEVPAG
jgi:hypothetical protein